MPSCVPEPEKKKPDDDQSEQVAPIVVVENGSDDDEDQDDHELDLELQGYQPLPAAENLTVSSDEEEDNEPVSDSIVQPRSLEVNCDLVKSAMENVKLGNEAIPSWAKEISESAWNEVVQQTINGQTPSKDDDSESPSTSKSS